VLRPRTSTGDAGNREMAQAGARFETYVRAAMAEADGLPTMAELYRQSGIAASTWSGWFRGVNAPRRNSMILAGQALNRTPEQLLSVWDGEKPHKPRRGTEPPDAVVAAMDRQTAAIEAQTEMLERVLLALLPSPPDPMEAEALEAWAGAERRLEQERAESTTLPRKPARGRRDANRGSASPEAERA
jgi:hypothetical protein